jgi:peroxisomal membrane protein 2
LVRWIPGVTARDVAVRVFADQFLFSPVFLAGFFATLLTLEGRPEKLKSKLESDFVDSVTSCWSLLLLFSFLCCVVVLAGL